MPVILRPAQFDSWLDGLMGVDDIKTPIDDDYLRRRRVARRVNSSRAPNDDPTLIDGRLRSALAPVATKGQEKTHAPQHSGVLIRSPRRHARARSMECRARWPYPPACSKVQLADDR